MKPEVVANNLLEELGIKGLPVLPQEICRQLAIHYCEDHFRGFEGTLAVHPKGQYAYIGVNSLIREPGRKNFTCAHELGHYCMDFDFESPREFICKKEMIESFKSKTPPEELSANQFAAGLLMPQAILQNLVDERDPGWDSIKELAAISETSLLATALRFLDLTSHACMLIVCQDGQIQWFRKSQEFALYMTAKTIPPSSSAFSAFNGTPPEDCFEPVCAEAWLSGRGINPKIQVQEWSLPINSYGQVLTLLWDEDGIEGWDGEIERDHDDDEVEWDPPTLHKSRRKR